MSSAEYADWKEFFECEPWGLGVWDSMHAHVMSMLANVNRDSETNPQPYTLQDFLLFNEPEIEAVTIDDVRSAFGFSPKGKRKKAKR